MAGLGSVGASVSNQTSDRLLIAGDDDLLARTQPPNQLG